MGGLQLGKLALAFIMVLFSITAVYISYLIGERQRALDKVSRYNVAWSASQAVTEVGRLKYQVLAIGLPGGSGSRDEVGLRYDILVNRARLFSGGEVHAFARQDHSMGADQFAMSRDKLLTIAWFAWIHGLVTGWLAWLKALPAWVVAARWARAIKRRARGVFRLLRRQL